MGRDRAIGLHGLAVPGTGAARGRAARHRPLAVALGRGVAVLLAMVATTVPLTSAASAAPSAAATAQHTEVVATSAGRAFACSTPTIFLAQKSPTQLYASLYGAGTTNFDKLGPTSRWNYNAIGYDPANRYIYAISLSSRARAYPAGHLLKIGSKGAVQDLGAINGDHLVNTKGAVTGSFDGSDHFWITSPGRPDVDEVSLTAHPHVTKHAVESPKSSLRADDFTWDSGFMWGMAPASKGSVIERLSLSTGKVSHFVAPAAITRGAAFGAAWTYGNGNLGFDNNSTGAVYQVSVTNPASAAPTFQVISTYKGPIASTNDDATACVPTPVDLSVSESGPATATAAAPISWTDTVTNHGPGISSGYVLSDTLPTGVTHVAASAAGCTVSSGTVRCDEGRLSIGGSATYKITGNAPARGGVCVTNSVTVLGNEHDPKPANNTSSVQTCISDAAPTLGSQAPTPSAGVAGATFHDSVTLSGGVAPSGTITYSLYGPSDATCSQTPVETFNTSVDGDGIYSSAGAVLTTVGTYHWIAAYGGDAENAPASTLCAAGAFTVTPAPPGTCTISWAGPLSGGLWSTTDNWTPSRVPTAGDVVCIGSSAAPLTGPVVFDGSNGTGDTAVAQLKSYATLDVTGGELYLTDTSSSPAEASFTSGIALGGGQFGDTTNDSAGLTDSGAFSWTGGSFYAPTSQDPQPAITQTGGGTSTIDDPYYLSHWSLNLDGALAVSGDFYLQNGGAITASGAVTASQGGNISNTGGAGDFTITSTGSFTQTGPTGLTLGVPVSNAGTITASLGGLTLASLSNTGTLDVGTSDVTIDSAYAPLSGSVLDITIDGTTSGTDLGDLDVQGEFTLGGTLSITTPASFTPSDNETFTVANYTSVGGSFTQITGATSYTETAGATSLSLEAT